MKLNNKKLDQIRGKMSITQYIMGIDYSCWLTLKKDWCAQQKG